MSGKSTAPATEGGPRAPENCHVTMDGDFAVIRINTKHNAGETASGARRIATSHGWAPLGDSDARFSLNVVTSDKIAARASQAQQIAALQAEVEKLRAAKAA